MQLRVVTSQPWDVKADVLAIPVVGDPAFDGPQGELDRRSGGELKALAAFGELTAKRYSTALATSGDLSAGRLLVIGAGEAEKLDREAVVRIGSSIERRLGGRKVGSLAIWLTPLSDALADGGATAVAELVARGVVIAEGANMARTLANRASNDVSPEVLADEAYTIARKHRLWIDVIGPERATELGMGMFMAVGRGSDNPPRMIVMRSGGEGEKDRLDRHVALVGKGVCFDSGGISIKPAERMDEMKMDKTGACTVIAAIATVARLKPGTPLLAVAPAVENMPGPHSTRPGDVVKALNGKMVDITNTDAEGRLILGDAMTYAERLGATHLVDVATLTGAVARALGNQVTGAFGQEQRWYDNVVAAGSRAGERYWQIPLIDDYVPDMESWYGDLQNAGSAEGSLVKSGLFLREFVTRPWVHLDIAGTAYFRKATPYAARGATGVAHATLVELALAGAR